MDASNRFTAQPATNRDPDTPGPLFYAGDTFSFHDTNRHSVSADAIFCSPRIALCLPRIRQAPSPSDSQAMDTPGWSEVSVITDRPGTSPMSCQGLDCFAHFTGHTPTRPSAIFPPNRSFTTAKKTTQHHFFRHKHNLKTNKKRS